MILNLLRAVRDDFNSPQARFNYLNFFLCNLPGEVGVLLRSAILSRFFRKAGQRVRVLQGARFNGVNQLEVGDGVMIGIDNFFQASAGLIIGDNTITGPGVKIWTINHRTDSVDRPIQKQGYQNKPVRIGSDVWLGSNVFVMPGVEIPDGCVVSAGSVVGVKRYPPYSIIAGHPATVIGRRQRHDEQVNPAAPCVPAAEASRPAAGYPTPAAPPSPTDAAV